MYSMHELDCKGKDLGGGGDEDDEDLTYSLTQSLTYRPAKKRSNIHSS